MSKKFIVIVIVSLLSLVPCIHAMEEESLYEPRQEEVVEIATQNEEQSHFEDDTLITVNLEDDNGQIAFSIDLPYKAVRLSNTLHHNISFDQNAENKIITVPVANISGIEMGEFKTTLEILELFISKKFEKEYLARIFTKKNILKLLNVVDYLDCQQLNKLFTEALHYKTQKLLFEKNKLKKALDFVQIIENPDHHDHLLYVACNNLKNKQLKYVVKSKKQLEGSTFNVTSICFSPGDFLVSAFHDGFITLWNRAGAYLNTFQAHSKRINSVCFSPNGKYFASASDDHTIKVWDLNGSCLHTFQGHTDSVYSVCFSPDGNPLASVSGDHTIKVWDLNGSCLPALEISDGFSNNSVCFSPDGNYLAAAWGDNWNDNTIKLWNRTGSCVRTFKGHTGYVGSVCFSPDGNSLSSASDDIKVWDLSGTCLQTFQTYTNGINSICFSPDGNFYLVSADDDTIIKLWDLTGSCVRTFQGNDERVRSICFSPDGKHFASRAFNTIFIYTFYDLTKDFTLSTLLLLEYVMHHKEQGTLQRLPSEPFYFDLYLQLSLAFQEMVAEAFDQDALKEYETKKSNANVS